MTEAANSQSFVRRWLPWILAAAVGFVFMSTLSHWITLRGLPAQAQVLGWSWQPVFFHPLYYLLTLPITALPGSIQVTALNVFSMLCSLAALALLARSVSILPHDRTRDQREIEHSAFSTLSVRLWWLPPTLAVLVCALQLTFWEHAVMSSSEALDLLVFAYLIWELLEHRIDQREIRLLRFAMVYGVGITNNFALIGFAPLFLIALIWIKGVELFNPGLLLRLALGFVAGLSWYLLLPAIHTLSANADYTFWEMLKTNLVAQKNSLAGFPRFILLFIGLTSVLPVLFMAIKWPANFGDVSAIGTALTNLMTHIIHAVFLLACIYVAFDPPFSPRQLSGGGYALLPFYYLGALSIGYFSGYFLLISSPAYVANIWRRDPAAWRKAVHYGIRMLVWLALVAVPVGLLAQNWSKIRAATSKHLSDTGQRTAECLPQAGAVLLSDDALRLLSLKAALRASGKEGAYIVVDTSSLSYPVYHRTMRRKHGQAWPLSLENQPAEQRIDSGSLVNFLVSMSHTRPTYYLHPSFGYYFERFYLKPEKLIYRLTPYPPDVIEAPLPSPAEFQVNDAYWKELASRHLPALIQALKAQSTKDQAGKPAAGQLEISYPGAMFSRMADFLGVQYQRAGDLLKADEYYKLALDLNPENPVAFINSEFNAHLRKGGGSNFGPSDGATKRLGPYRGNWDQILGVNGPIDEPNSCYIMSQVFARSGNFRQSAQALLRTLKFQPDLLPARLALAGALIQSQWVDKALDIVTDTKSLLATRPAETNGQLALLQLEAWALLRKNKSAEAEKLLTEAIAKYPQEPTPYVTLMEFHLARKDHTNALAVLEKQLKNQPQNTDALANYGAVKIQLGQLTEALPYLNQALKLDARHRYALLSRAIVNLQTGKIDEAERDYTTLERILLRPTHPVSFGLAETARLKKNRKEALERYEEFLKLAPPGTPDIPDVMKKIKELQSGT